MKFRIFNYLSLKNFFKCFFIYKKIENSIATKEIRKLLKKDFINFVGMGRTGLVLILRYLKKKNPHKSEIIVQAYHLPGFLEIIEIEKFKIIFVDLDVSSGVMSSTAIEKKINSKTAAVIFTNMFNNLEQISSLKKKLHKKNIPLIEDNSIFFDNFSTGPSKKYSGQIGNFTILSFNIMKNVSAFYGGAIAHNSSEFNDFCNTELTKFKEFPNFLLLKQALIYVILKVMAIDFFYRNFFFKIIYLSDYLNITFLKNIFYPSLRFKKRSQLEFIYRKISFLSKKAIYLQINNKNSRRKNFLLRKSNNTHLEKKLIDNYKNLKTVNLLPIKDQNYQNFLDFPILVNNKDKFVKFMFNNKIEVRKFHYYNCEKFFSNKKVCKNSTFFEKNLICIPTHPMITKSYLNYIISKILEYDKKI